MDNEPVLRYMFDVEIQVDAPIFIGSGAQKEMRRIVRIKGGEISGRISGRLLPGGTDHQRIRPNGDVEIFARYAAQLEDEATIYIEAWGIRRADRLRVKDSAQGRAPEVRHNYFVTHCRIETYDEPYKWLE